MPTKNIVFVLLITGLFAASCDYSHDNKLNTRSTGSLRVKKHAAGAAANQMSLTRHIDSLTADTNKLIVLVKVPGRDTLLQVKNGSFPDDIETTYNLYKNPEGKVIFAAEIPYSESGDWFIDYKSYFDDSGRLAAFVREASFFDDECAGDGAVHESLTKYYDKNLRLIDSVYTIRDGKNNPIKKSACINDYNYPYHIIKLLDVYLKAKHITI